MDHQGKHAIEFIEHLGANSGVQFDDEFRIAGGPHRNVMLPGKVEVVVDLTIEHQRVSTARIDEWLVGSLIQVENAEPIVSEGNPTRRTGITDNIGPTMLHQAQCSIKTQAPVFGIS